MAESGNKDDKIQRITSLLEKGGTMLATHHECGAPMFRYQGKIVCPVCDYIERKEMADAQGTLTGGKQPEINNMIMNKIRELAVSLETETDLIRARDKLECIEHGLKILKLLHEMN